MNVLESRVETTQGHPLLVVVTDLCEMRIGLEQKLAERGLLFAGPDMEGVLPEIKLPGDRANGQAPLTLRGFTREKDVVRLWREFEAEHG